MANLVTSRLFAAQITWFVLLAFCFPTTANSQLVVGELFFLGGSFSDSTRLNHATLPLHHDTIVSEFGCSSSLEYFDFYRNGGMESNSASFHRVLQQRFWMIRSGRVPWQMAVNYRDAILVAGFQNSASAQSFQYHEYISEEAIQFRLKPHRRLILGSVLTINQNQDPGYTFDAEISVAPVAEVGVKWRHQRDRSLLQGTHQTDLLKIRYSSMVEEFSTSISTAEWYGMSLSGTKQWNQWIQYHLKKPQPWLEPFGTSTNSGVGWQYHSNHQVLQFGYEYHSKDLQAYGWEEPYPFAKMTTIETSENVYQILYQNQLRQDFQWQLGMVHTNGTGYSRGHVEFWPFGSGWVDFLSLRRYYIANWKTRSYSPSFSVTMPLQKSLQMTAQMRMIDLFATGTMRHWRPLFLVFGVDDEQFASLPVSRIQLGGCRVDIRYQLSDIVQLDYAFEQLFPIAQWKNQSPGDPSEAPASNASQAASRSYGGGHHRLMLSVRMH